MEDDSLSTADDLNTLVAVLNKINAAGVLSLRTTQIHANQLLVSLLETQLVDAARRRDAEVAAINGAVLFSAGRAVASPTSSAAGRPRPSWDSACRSEASP